MNFLQETKNAIEEAGQTIQSIRFIGSEQSGHSCTWDEFCKLADFEYSNGQYSPVIATDLIIVFRDGSRIWRSTYDGAEHWFYPGGFKEPEVLLPIKSLMTTTFDHSLHGINET